MIARMGQVDPKSHMCRLVMSVIVLAATGLLLAARGQSSDATETIRIDTALVNLNVSVFNLRTSQTTDLLQQKDFAIFENGATEQTLLPRDVLANLSRVFRELMDARAQNVGCDQTDADEISV